MNGTLTENLKRQKLEEMEFNEIDAILPSLLKEDLITDIECRIIVSYNKLLEKQGAVHKTIMSKTKEVAARLTEIFRTLAMTIHADVLSKTRRTSDANDEQKDNLPQDKPNPLLHNTILACLFGYLPLDEIKYSRLVCRQWNSVAEIGLRKRCKIHFRPDNLTPQTFMEVSKYSLPDLPFSAYKFSEIDYAMCVDQIKNFFDKWGKNIKEVELVLLNKSHRKIYDVTPWIMKTPNLCSLKIGWVKDKFSRRPKGTLFRISIEKLATIKTVFLKSCRILTNGERVSFLPFSNVSLINVSFQRLRNIVRDNFCYNEFFDFSQTANLAISNEYQNGVKFNMEGQLNKKELYLRFVTLENWTKAKGDVNLLTLYGCDFTERNGLNITRMVIDNSDVNLSVLPQTLEKLQFGEQVNIVSTEPFQLPNLKYCVFEADDDNSKMLTHFATVGKYAVANCPNLTEMLLAGTIDKCHTAILDLDCIPRSVTKLRIDVGILEFFEFANGDQSLEIDTLLLFNVEHFSVCKTILQGIKPKVLVMSYFRCVDPMDPSDIVEIILNQKQIGTVVVGPTEKDDDLHGDFPFEGSTFANYVDKKSKYYKFENQVGHAIECKEYQNFSGTTDEDDDYFSFCVNRLL